jgi:hypothetical protein
VSASARRDNPEVVGAAASLGDSDLSAEDCLCAEFSWAGTFDANGDAEPASNL